MPLHRADPDREAALGFRAHSGWAVLVAVAGPAGEASAVLRRRVELSVKTPRQPFHAAEALELAAAEELVRRSTAEAADRAESAVRDAVAELRARGRTVAAAGLLVAAGRALPALPAILASHALIHAAEGELFRDVLRRACRGCGLGLVEAREREIEERASRSLGFSTAQLQNRVGQWGKALGPPWTQDEKRAALAAWLALGERPGKGPRRRSS